MESYLHYSQFPFWSEIGKLINQFFEDIKNPNTWVPNVAPAVGMWHEWDLPFIGVSDEVNTQDSLFDGRLGKYQAIDSNWEKEGRIVLFRKNIHDVALECSIKLDFSHAECFNAITKIVTIHELGHWIFHYMPTKESEKNDLYDKFDSDLKEAIAQHFVRLVIKIDENLKEIFEWMLERQDQIYKNELPGDVTGISSLRSFAKRLYSIYCNSHSYETIGFDDFLRTENFPKTLTEYSQYLNSHFHNKYLQRKTREIVLP